MENGDWSERIVGLVEVLDHDDGHDAYIRKLVDLFGLLVVMNILTTLGKVKEGGVEIECDGLSTFHCSFWDGVEDISSAQPHFDILSELHGIKREMVTVWRYMHITGHQEDTQKEILDRWALLNIACGMYAEAYWTDLVRSGRRR